MSSQETPEFTPASTDCLHALCGALEDGRPLDELHTELMAAARACAADVRNCRLRAEHLVIALREQWRTISLDRTLPADTSSEALERLVSVAITEFYRGKQDGPAAES